MVICLEQGANLFFIRSLSNQVQC